MRLWPGVMNPFDAETGESIYGLKFGLDAIWKNQFPSNCSTAKFLISSSWPFGFGSRMHTEGWGLAVAMQLGRIYLPHPDGDNIFYETNVPHCRDRNKPGLSCFYEEWSSCSIADALLDVGGDVNKLNTIEVGDIAHAFVNDNERSSVIASLASHRSLNMVFTRSKKSFNSKHFIPFEVANMLNDCSPINKNFTYYWWRAVSVTFLIRPNEPTLALLANHRTLALSERDMCIGMFVRHGDKGVEMSLLPFSTYAQTAKDMWEKGYVPKYIAFNDTNNRFYNMTNVGVIDGVKIGHPPPQPPSIFLTTEDPAVIKEATEWGAQNGWKVLYTNLFDRESVTARLDWQQQTKKGSVARHHDLEYISILLNLEYALRCEAWVCTLASNSCRVIDELRATVGGKANRYYADISKETCSNPPCIEGGVYYLGD